jgi:uncharacterized protein (TIGR03437 family)
VPAIFSVNGQGFGQASVYDVSNHLVDASNPATAGSILQIYATGLGPVSNQPASGSPATNNPPSVTATFPLVSISGADVPVVFSGLVPGMVGLYQVNVVVPEGLPSGPSQSLQMVMLGANSNSNGPTIAVK